MKRHAKKRMSTSDGRLTRRQWAVISTSMCTDRSRPRIKEVKTTLAVSSTRSHQVKTPGMYSNAGKLRRAVLIFCSPNKTTVFNISLNIFPREQVPSFYLYHGFLGRLARFLEQCRDVQDVARQMLQDVQQRRSKMTSVRFVIAAQQNSRTTARLGRGLACTTVPRGSVFDFRPSGRFVSLTCCQKSACHLDRVFASATGLPLDPLATTAGS